MLARRLANLPPAATATPFGIVLTQRLSADS